MKSIMLFSLLCTLTLACAQEVLDGVAARVNGTDILFSQIRAEVGARERTLRETYKGAELVEAAKKLRPTQLDRMIDRLLLIHELKKKGIALPSEATDEQIDAAIKRLSGNREEWLKRLKSEADIKIY